MGGIDSVLDVLEQSGYKRLRAPLTVVGSEFDFEAVATGTGASHDLVLVSSSDVSAQRLQRLVAGLARSLDLAASRRPVSLVHLGGITAAGRADLERFARVLSIASLSPSETEIRDALSVLLPMKLPTAELVHGGDSINEVLASLGPVKYIGEHLSLLRAAPDGSGAVREALRQYINNGAGWVDGVVGDNE